MDTHARNTHPTLAPGIRRGCNAGMGCGLLGLLLCTLAFTWMGVKCAQTDEAKWAAGLVFAVGGPMLGAALLYDLREGTVVSVKRGSPAKPALFATVTIEYPSSDGTTRTLISRIHNSSKDFDRLQPGMKVKVMECATDPGIAFMLGGHSDAGSKKCELAGTSP